MAALTNTEENEIQAVRALLRLKRWDLATELLGFGGLSMMYGSAEEMRVIGARPSIRGLAEYYGVTYHQARNWLIYAGVLSRRQAVPSEVHSGVLPTPTVATDKTA